MVEAYRIKNIHYQGNDRKILLQNENGPCPLLACANALLLRGVISLPSVSVRNGAANLEEVINMLAEKAMNYSHQSEEGSEDTSHHHHIHEVLDLLPNLQHGMDINPRFNSPTGMEFTKELSTFDLLNVKMVHGWIVDPTEEIANVIGTKTYNELIEVVIHGNEANTELQKIEVQLKKLEPFSGDEMIDIGVLADFYGTGEGESKKPAQTQQTVGQLRATFKEKQEDLSHKATIGSLINNFLETTGHQLTFHGLQVLYKDLAENELCVLFRNNHFSTLTKHEGYLFLLVTDLGYANVPNVVWEKIDVIDGDTEYVDSNFSRPAPQADLKAAYQGPNLEPEQLLAQRGQTETDYQLALQLSGQQGGTGNAQGGQQAANNNFDEQEGQLMSAATEASLRAYNGLKDETPPPQQQQQQQPFRDPTTTQEDSDHVLAMQLQADMEQNDMRLAKQMQEKEWAEQGNNNPNNINAATATTGPASKNSNCVIS